MKTEWWALSNTPVDHTKSLFLPTYICYLPHPCYLHYHSDTSIPIFSLWYSLSIGSLSVVTLIFHHNHLNYPRNLSHSWSLKPSHIVWSTSLTYWRDKTYAKLNTLTFFLFIYPLDSNSKLTYLLLYLTGPYLLYVFYSSAVLLTYHAGFNHSLILSCLQPAKIY